MQHPSSNISNIEQILHHLKHYLPAQAPLKDFVHHNTLHAFQQESFHEALNNASSIFGYKTYLSLDEFRGYYTTKRIHEKALIQAIERTKSTITTQEWLHRLLEKKYPSKPKERIGRLRSLWKDVYSIDLDALVHPILFRLICSYLDQGIAIWNFPVKQKGLLASVQEMERNSFSSFFKTKQVKQLLLNNQCAIADLLKKIVGTNEALYEQYLFDQHFAHQGWSGMVSAIEDNPSTLLDSKAITFHDLVTIELLLELDALYYKLQDKWQPLDQSITNTQIPEPLFAPVPTTEYHEVMRIWQEAFEWTYYDQVLAGIQQETFSAKPVTTKSFQALFCIDDRECSLRRYLEQTDSLCETFATPGFFGVEFYFKPDEGHFYTKLCPAPVTPKYLVKEENTHKKREIDVHFSKHSHSFYSGWIISQTLGFWSAFRLLINLFKPSFTPATASSLKHMEKASTLTIHNSGETEKGLQIGYTIAEMAQRVEALLKSIGLVSNFAPIVYLVGHGASSVNNPHYAAYDCGACSGRAGSVNARIMSNMANHTEVRKLLAEKGIHIPDSTQFIGALHDTTRDEAVFYDEETLLPNNLSLHKKNEAIFQEALALNARERSRRFESINTQLTPQKIHEKIKIRSVSLFEPRPELNHATNALCIVGNRNISRGLFLDRRSFLNSYDYKIDPDGRYLLNILKAVAPVCGGINLEYYFSRVDNQKLGAGSKLPHNVMGLFGVANGIDGDLRCGLPSQMVEVHDPVRLMVIVEHFPEVVLATIKENAATYEWFKNAWVNLAVVTPVSKQVYVFSNEELKPYTPLTQQVPIINSIEPLLASNQENFPVYILNNETA